MIEMAFAAEDLVHTRFAISPLWEAVASVRALRDPGAHALHLPWVEVARPRAGDLDLGPLEALLGARGGYTPDFLTPPPGTPLPDLDAELERLRATPPREVRRELALRFPSRRPPAVLRPLVHDTTAELGRLAELIGCYWDRALATVGRGGCSAGCTARSASPEARCGSPSPTMARSTWAAGGCCWSRRRSRGPRSSRSSTSPGSRAWSTRRGVWGPCGRAATARTRPRRLPR